MNEFLSDSLAQVPFEDAFTQLEQIVNSLERGDATLDDSLSLYERGKALADHCMQLLNQAELKIKQLSGDEIVPFEQND